MTIEQQALDLLNQALALLESVPPIIGTEPEHDHALHHITIAMDDLKTITKG